VKNCRLHTTLDLNILIWKDLIEDQNHQNKITPGYVQFLKINYFISVNYVFFALYLLLLYRILAGAPRRSCDGTMANVNSHLYICYQTLIITN